MYPAAYSHIIPLSERTEKANTHRHSIHMSVRNISFKGTGETTYLSVESGNPNTAVMEFKVEMQSPNCTQDNCTLGEITRVTDNVELNTTVDVGAGLLQGWTWANISETGAILSFMCYRGTADECSTWQGLFEQTMALLQPFAPRRGGQGPAAGASSMQVNTLVSPTELQIKKQFPMNKGGLNGSVEQARQWDLKEHTVRSGNTTTQLMLAEHTAVKIQSSVTLVNAPYHKNADGKRKEFEDALVSGKVHWAIERTDDTDVLQEIQESRTKVVHAWDTEQQQVVLQPTQKVTTGDLEIRKQEAKGMGRYVNLSPQVLINHVLTEHPNATHSDSGQRRSDVTCDIFQTIKLCVSGNYRHPLGLCPFLKENAKDLQTEAAAEANIVKTRLNIRDRGPDCCSEAAAKYDYDDASYYGDSNGCHPHNPMCVDHNGKQDDAYRHVVSQVMCAIKLFNSRSVPKQVGLFYSNLEEAIEDCLFAGAVYEEKGASGCGTNTKGDTDMDNINNAAGANIVRSGIGLTSVQQHKNLLKIGIVRVRISWPEIHSDTYTLKNRMEMAVLTSKDVPRIMPPGRIEMTALTADKRTWSAIIANEDPKGYPYDLYERTPIMHYEDVTTLHSCTVVAGKPFRRFNQANWHLVEHVRAGVTYTIETSNLGQACDTVILVLDHDFTKIGDNDDCAGHRRSCFTFTASGSRFWVRVSRFDYWSLDFPEGNTYDISVFETSCIKCQPGHATQESGVNFLRHGCVKCQRGTWGAGGTARCLDLKCSPGSAPSKEAATSEVDGCLQCEQGLYGEGGNMPCQRMACSGGHHASAVPSGAIHQTHGCQECPAGTKSPGGSALSCAAVDSCAAGFVPSVAGAANDSEACTPVAVGLYSLGGAQAKEMPTTCNPGSIATKPEATSPWDGCVPCAGATYSAGGSATECLNKTCSIGSYSNVSGGTSPQDGCSLCPAGKFRAAADPLQACKDKICPPGSFSDVQGTVSETDLCQSCPQGKFGAGGASRSCQTCPTRMTAPAGSSSISACVCQEGYKLVAGSCKHVTTARSCPSGYKETGKYYYARKYCHTENESGHHCNGGCTVAAHWASGGPSTCRYWKTGYTKFGCVFGHCCCRYKDCNGSGYDPDGGTCTPDTITNRECIAA